FSQDTQNSSTPNKTEMTPWRKKKPILRWHSYQSLVLGARMKAPELYGVWLNAIRSCRTSAATTRLKDAGMELLSDAVARTDKQSPWSEVFALILLFVGTLLFFALISYTPKDVPSWIWFSHISPSNHPAKNFIEAVCAILAGICYQCIGVFASLLLAAVLLGFGAAKLFHPRLRVTPRIPWIVLFILSGACLDQLWDISHLIGLKVPVDIQGSGGLIGYRLADEHRGLLRAALGPVGSLLLVLGIYATTLILVTGLRPIHLVRETVGATRRVGTRLREWQLQRKLGKLNLKEKLEISERQLAKQRRSLEKQLKKKGMPVPEPLGATISAEELANRPTPKVVDTTAFSNAQVVPGGRNTSLAEVPSRAEKPKLDSSPE